MKLLTEYLAHALQFEHLAADESEAILKEALEQQAKAYRKLAENDLSERSREQPESKIVPG